MSRFQNMMDAQFMTESPQIVAILTAQSKEVDRLRTNIRDVLNQFYVDTATWGLDRWEKIAGIPTIKEMQTQWSFYSSFMVVGQEIEVYKPIEERRAAIKYKLRGMGKVDRKFIKNICDGAIHGESVNVTFDAPTKTITIQFTSTDGIPSDMDTLIKSLELVKPVHLKIAYEFKYMTYSTYTQLTYDQLQTVTYDKFGRRL